MNHWQELLANLPHHIEASGQIRLESRSARPPLLIPRADLAALRCTGGDWRKMLQGQTTCDLDAVTPQHSLPGALCTPKGRMVANFRLIPDGDNLLIVTHATTAESLQTTLGKFAPFFRVKLDQTDLPLLATLTDPAGVASLFNKLCSDVEFATGVAGHWQHGKVVAISPQQLLVTIDEDIHAGWQQLAELAQISGTEDALLAEIRDGMGWITRATSEEFIPQMLGLHHIGAVSFKKGCYTGQEVVARMQYLGKLKRHLYRLQLTVDQPPAPGTTCHLPDATQNCGHVVMAAATERGVVEALVVLTTEGAASDQLRLDDEPDLIATQQLDLPFEDAAS